MTDQETTFLYVVFFSVMIVAAGFKIYANYRSNQLKALEKLYKALEALGTLQGKLWHYNSNPTPESKKLFTSDIIAPTSMYLPWTDVEFLHAISLKSETEIKQFSKHIHNEIMTLIEFRDRLHTRIYGRTIP